MRFDRVLPSSSAHWFRWLSRSGGSLTPVTLSFGGFFMAQSIAENKNVEQCFLSFDNIVSWCYTLFNRNEKGNSHEKHNRKHLP